MHELLTLFSKSRLDPDYGAAFYGSIPSNFTFTRSTGNATYFDANGVMQYAGVNEPRFNHYPVSGEARCLMIESQATNRISNSDVSTWTSGSTPRPTLTANQGIAPDATNTFTKWERSTLGPCYAGIRTSKYFQNIPCRFSIYAKKGNVDTLAVRVQGVYPARVDASFNLATGETTVSSNTFTGEYSKMEYIGNGIYRCIIGCATSNNKFSFFNAISFNNINSTQIDCTDDKSDSYGYVWGAQNEYTKTHSSYIPTNGSAVTRATDILKNTNLPWWNATAGTMYIECVQKEAEAFIACEFNDGSYSNRCVVCEAGSTGLSTRSFAYSGGVLQGSNNTARSDLESPLRVAYSIQKDRSQNAVNGVVGSVDTSFDMPIGIDRLFLSGGGAGGVALIPSVMYLRSFKYWRTALNDAELERITK